MAPSAKEHHRSKSLLLLQKLLNLRDSPLTLIVDNLEQTAAPLLKEFAARARISKSKVVFVSFTTFKKPAYADVFVPAWGRSLTSLCPLITAHFPVLDKAAVKAKSQPRAIVVIDSINAFISAHPDALGPFLSSIILPTSSLLAIHHADTPVLLPPHHCEYTPHPLTLLTHLATAILRLSPLAHDLAIHAARNRALADPVFGLSAEKEGVLLSLRRPHDPRGVVIAMELRRKSGRQVAETFFMVDRPAGDPRRAAGLAALGLLADHPAFAKPVDEGADKEDGPQSTFSLGLTEKQRRDREEIVLPYFDAQTDVGGGEGGRILYDMGREDDFDDEEDEI
ncbi:hypothetical protein TD95_000203 [Thielaviopsis punctulata]|uniref:Elongator complex protein 5 n=1 Tax=Thielaviopsis punctulata TaxID=72032 RepID=A0A0F4ZCX5_9PEZI|nr:hypothetical protein TD95_000203 [Thielaviopsis punctulata]